MKLRKIWVLVIEAFDWAEVGTDDGDLRGRVGCVTEGREERNGHGILRRGVEHLSLSLYQKNWEDDWTLHCQKKEKASRLVFS